MSASFVSTKGEGRGIYGSKKKTKSKSPSSFPVRVCAVVARTTWPEAEREIMQVNDDREKF